MTDLWSSRLSEYLDGELPAREAEALEEHLASCESCRGELDSLRRVLGRLDAAPDREPAADLWPGLRRKIEADGSPGSAPATVRTYRPAEKGPLGGWRIALPLAAAALLLASLWWWQRGGAGSVPGPGEAGSPAVARDAAAPGLVAGRYDQAASAWNDHLAGRDLPPEVAEVLEAEMAVFDRAIAETRQALAEAPADPDLRAHLAATLRAKVRFLARIGEFAGETS